jgi:hypothetical protein
MHIGSQPLFKPIRVLLLDDGERLDLAKISVLCSRELTQPVSETLLGFQSTAVVLSAKFAGGRLTKTRDANISILPSHGFLGFYGSIYDVYRGLRYTQRKDLKLFP